MRGVFLIVGLLGATGATAITGFHGWHLGQSLETSATFAFFFSFVSLAAMFGPLTVSVVLRRAAGLGKLWAVLFAIGAAAAFAGNALNSLDAVVTRFDRTKAGRDTETDARKEFRAELARLVTARAELPAFAPTSQAMVDAARAAVAAAEATRKDECAARGKFCRDREADEREKRVQLAKALADAALTAQANRIDGEVTKLRQTLGVAPATTTSDPWANAVAKYFAIQEGDASTLRWFYLSIVVELSVALFLFAFELLGANKAEQRKNASVSSVTEPARDIISAPTKEPQPTPSQPTPKAVAQPVAKLSGATVERFMLNCLPREDGSEASWGDIYRRYLRYCEAESFEAVNPNEFGRRLDDICRRVGIRTTKRDGKAFCLDVKVAA